MNFFKDYTNILKSILDSNCVKYQNTDDLYTIVVIYLRYYYRYYQWGENKRYCIQASVELVDKLQNEKFPKEVIVGFHYFGYCAVLGKSLRKFLPSKYREDYQLDCWGLYHFHICKEKYDDYLLSVIKNIWVEDNTLYLVDIRTHRNTFQNEELMQIVVKPPRD